MENLRFRAWDKKNKIMVPVDEIAFTLDGEVLGIKWVVNEIETRVVLAKDLILIQYTGRQDSEGVEIYDGDILEVVHLHDGHDQYWNQPTGPAIPTVVTWEGLGWDMPRDTFNFKIISNIYENHALIPPA